MKDANFAQRLAGDLQRMGVRVWIAPQNILPGEGWVKAIERGLRESSHVVIALTPNAVASQWVEKETEVAIARERRGQIEVIPLDVEACQVPLLLSSYQMVSFRRDYEAGLNQLADRLGLRVKPSGAEEKPRRLRGLPLLAFVALLLVVIGAILSGLAMIGLIGDGQEPAYNVGIITFIREDGEQKSLHIMKPDGSFLDIIDGVADLRILSTSPDRQYLVVAVSKGANLVTSFEYPKFVTTEQAGAGFDLVATSVESGETNRIFSTPIYYADAQFTETGDILVAVLEGSEAIYYLANGDGTNLRRIYNSLNAFDSATPTPESTEQ